MAKVLFIPSDHGGGYGHVSRCIFLAKKMKAHGHQTAVVLEPKHYVNGLNAGLETFVFKTKIEKFIKYQFKRPHRPFVNLKSKILKPPVFVEFSSLAYQIPRDGYLSEKIVNSRIKRFQRIINKFKPDALVGDTHFLTYILGRKNSIPVIQITRLAGFPPHPDFFWWEETNRHLIEPDALAPFNKIISKLNLTDIQKTEDLLRGDRYIIPSNKKMEPVKINGNNVIYGGAFTEDYHQHQRIPFFAEKNEYPRIFVTIGGGAERGQEKQFFDAILEFFNKTEFKVLVSTGRKIAAKKYKEFSRNVFIVDWINGMSAIKQSDLVIYHGGYSTTMEVLLAGKPSIVIPSHSEQEGNGRRLESLGVGKTVLPYKSDLQPLEYKWTYGNFNMMAGFDFSLDSNELHEKMKEVLYSDAYNRLSEMSNSLLKLQEKLDSREILDF